MPRKMRDSGVAWIGAIPDGWEMSPLKRLVSCNDEVLPETTPAEFLFDYIDVGSVKYGKGIVGTERMRFADSPSRARRFVREDDVIVSTVRTYLKSVANIPDSKIPLIASTGFAALRSVAVNPGFLKYLVQAESFVSEVESKSVGISYPAINASELIRIKVPTPSRNEQQEIANFLDAQCAEIDAAIDSSRKSIEDYKALKKSLVFEAVTGLRSGMRLKESGVGWVKEIPEHWQVVPAKSLFSIRKDRAREGDRQLTASQRRGIMFQDDFMREEGQKVVTVEKDFSILKHVEPGDFVISMRSFQGGLEYSELAGSISSAYVMLIPNPEHVCNEYFKWLFKSDKYINAIQSTSNLIRDGQALRYANFAQIPLFRIPLSEQRAIADYLDEKCGAIDALVAEKEALIADLEAYKKSLIFEVVTGKREVV